MTAPVAPTSKRFTNPLHDPRVKKYGFFGVLALVLLIMFIINAGHHASPKDVSTETATAVVNALAQKGALGQTATPTTATTPPPNYDYIACTHWKGNPEDCTKLRPYPLTAEAERLIGWQGGTRINGTLDSDATREVADGILNLPGVDACNLYLGLVEDSRHVLKHVVYPDLKSASVGAAKLYDCTPVDNSKAPLVAPTAGAHE